MDQDSNYLTPEFLIQSQRELITTLLETIQSQKEAIQTLTQTVMMTNQNPIQYQISEDSSEAQSDEYEDGIPMEAINFLESEINFHEQQIN
jgi:ACT domain-containing protein